MYVPDTIYFASLCNEITKRILELNKCMDFLTQHGNQDISEHKRRDMLISIDDNIAFLRGLTMNLSIFCDLCSKNLTYYLDYSSVLNHLNNRLLRMMEYYDNNTTVQDPWAEFEADYAKPYRKYINDEIKSIKDQMISLQDETKDYYEKIPEKITLEEAQNYFKQATELKDQSILVQSKASEMNEMMNTSAVLLDGFISLITEQNLPGKLISALSSVLTTLSTYDTESIKDDATSLNEDILLTHKFVKAKYTEKMKQLEKEDIYEEIKELTSEKQTEYNVLLQQYLTLEQNCEQLQIDYQRLHDEYDALKKLCTSKIPIAPKDEFLYKAQRTLVQEYFTYSITVTLSRNHNVNVSLTYFKPLEQLLDIKISLSAKKRASDRTQCSYGAQAIFNVLANITFHRTPGAYERKDKVVTVNQVSDFDFIMSCYNFPEDTVFTGSTYEFVYPEAGGEVSHER